MTKSYSYQQTAFTVGASENIYFEVRYISNGNFGPTRINTPGQNDPLIPNAGMAFLGKGAELKNRWTVIVSRVRNPLPMHQEDEIIVEYLINGRLLVSHRKPKTEAVVADIFIDIFFV